MKNMLVLFDTNIILDVLEKRLSFYDSSKSVLERCVSGGVTGYIALHSVSNIFYILRKRYSAADRKNFSLIYWICCKWQVLTMRASGTP